MNKRVRLAYALGVATTLLLFFSNEARAQESHIHIVRPGETLAAIAQRYYGNPRIESVLVSENGLTAHGGAAIVVGMRLLIPSVTYHRVEAGETWSALATRFYGDPRRAFVLIETNLGTTGSQPDTGAQLVIPYPVRYVAAQGDHVSRIASLQYGDSEDGGGRLRRFNNLRNSRLQRGQMVLIPRADLVLTKEANEMIRAQTGRLPPGGEARQVQAEIQKQLPALREHLEAGRYTDVVALANRLLGLGDLTGNQTVTIHKELASAYVALQRMDLAVESFRIALSHQPDLELDPTRTSPVVLAAFHQAKTKK